MLSQAPQFSYSYLLFKGLSDKSFSSNSLGEFPSKNLRMIDAFFVKLIVKLNDELNLTSFCDLVWIQRSCVDTKILCGYKDLVWIQRSCVDTKILCGYKDLLWIQRSCVGYKHLMWSTKILCGVQRSCVGYKDLVWLQRSCVGYKDLVWI